MFFNSFLLILHRHSGPHSVSDCVCNELVSLWLIVCMCVCVCVCVCVHGRARACSFGKEWK